jgi:hypothetical protein
MHDPSLEPVLALGFTGYLVIRQCRDRFLAFIVVVVTASALVLSASRGAFSIHFWRNNGIRTFRV